MVNKGDLCHADWEEIGRHFVDFSKKCESQLRMSGQAGLTVESVVNHTVYLVRLYATSSFACSLSRRTFSSAAWLVVLGFADCLTWHHSLIYSPSNILSYRASNLHQDHPTPAPYTHSSGSPASERRATVFVDIPPGKDDSLGGTFKRADSIYVNELERVVGQWRMSVER